ncbi:ABC-2 type transport system permease protein [Hymenobacter sp. UYAg731]
MLKLILKYEWLHFRRNGLQLALLAGLVGFGLYAIYYGHRQLAAQQTALAQLEATTRTEWEGYRQAFGADTTVAAAKDKYEEATDPGYAWFRQGYVVRQEASALAPLVVGQRDLNPGHYRLTGMSLYYQLFQNELANPLKLLVGNFDLAFVLVYLLPLFVVALGYGLLAGEQESGVLPLLRVQAASVRRLLLGKLLFGFLLVTGLAVGLSLIGFVAVGARPGHDGAGLALWLLTVVSYCAFWWAVVWAVASFNRDSAVNALAGVGLWLLFLLVLPAGLSAALAVWRPVDSAALAPLVRRRSLDNEQDERAVRAVVRRYLRQHPGLAPPADTLFQPHLLTKAYAAFTQLTDHDNQALVANYLQAVTERDALAARFNVVNPAVHTQNLLSQTARTDLGSYVDFLGQIPAFHQRIVAFYYPHLFRNQVFALADYAHRPHFAPAPPPAGFLRRLGLGVAQLAALAALVFAAGYWNLPRHLRA